MFFSDQNHRSKVQEDVSQMKIAAVGYVKAVCAFVPMNALQVLTVAKEMHVMEGDVQVSHAVPIPNVL